MNNTYNSNMYLVKSDLNNIENSIYQITNSIKNNLYGTSSSLRNIETNDILDGKTLYLSFPINTTFQINNGEQIQLIKTNNNNTINIFRKNNYDYLYIEYNNKIYYLYIKQRVSNTSLDVNIKRFILPIDFGTVTTINTSGDFYSYISIYDDEKIIPNYTKHTWNTNEVLSMQNIDNIENGIKNIQIYYYKPIGWIESDEWLKTNDIENIDNNTNMKTISFQDFNRWLNNLSLINFTNLNQMTLWNTDYSQLTWDRPSDIEWEAF